MCRYPKKSFIFALFLLILPGLAFATETRPAIQPLPLPLKAPKLLIKKSERKLYLYNEGKLLRTYPIGLGFAPTGDKTKQGDGKTPEGKYLITGKNPKSRYYLSLAINYPNSQDADRAFQAKLISKKQRNAIRKAERNKTNPPWNTPMGGEIFIHGSGAGSDWTLGCVALDNPQMLELYGAIPVGTPVEILP